MNLFRLTVVARRATLALLLSSALAACRTAGPDIATYESAPVLAAPAAVTWSDDVWSAARAGDRPRLEGLLASPPIDDLMLHATRERLATLEFEAAARHHAEIVRLLTEADTTDDDIRLHALVELAEHRRAELDPGTDDEIAAILEPAIAHHLAVAEEATRTNRIDEAIEAWTTVLLLAADGRHSDLELQAMDRTSRLPVRRPGNGRSDPLPPRVVADCLRLVVATHVSRPDETDVVTAGFDAVADAASVIDDERDAARRMVEEIRTAYRNGLPSDDLAPSIASQRRRRALDDAARALAAARDDGRLPESMADPIRVFVDGMLSSTDLRTRAFLGGDAETIERLLGASFVGIGVRIRPHPGGLELQPLAGSPARRAGVRSGDVLVSIDDEPIARLTADEVMSRVAGRRGTAVELGVRRDGSPEPLAIVVVRDEIELESVHGWRQRGVDHDGRPIWDWILDPEACIAFVSIRQFDDDTDVRFRTAIRDANRALGPDRMVQGLVIDLRDDPGGHRVATERLIDLFVASGELIRLEGAPPGQDEARLADIRSTRLAGLPVVVLVDEHSASASELLAGMLQGAAEAVVVGERTFGKGSVQAVNPVADGHVLVTESWFLVLDDTTGEWRPIDRERTNDWGVTPDLVVAMSDRETAEVLAEHSGWVSGRGRDVADRDAETLTLETTTDRALLQALVLLRARLLPLMQPAATADQ